MKISLNNFFCITIFQVYDIYSSEQCDEHSDIHAILRLLNIRFGRETRVQQADCWIFRQGPGKFDPFQSLSTSSVSLKMSQCQAFTLLLEPINFVEQNPIETSIAIFELKNK